MGNWHILGLELAPGEKKSVALSIPVGGLENRGEILPGGRSGDGYELPATLINGVRPGKTLLVTAGIHSGEFNGTPAVIHAGKELDGAAMSGRVILMPCVNTSGFWTEHPRTLPEDGFNLNGQYPGRAGGTVGERVADFFVREVFPGVDFILDLHGGSRGERMTPLAFFPTHAQVRAAALAAAKALNVGCLVESRAAAGEYSYAAYRLGIPGLLIERGDGYFCSREWSQADYADIRLLMEHLGIAPAPESMRNAALRRRVFRETVYLEAARDGLWYPEADRDQPVAKGQLLGTLRDFQDNCLEEVRAAEDGYVLYVNTCLAMPKGGFLAAVGLAASEE